LRFDVMVPEQPLGNLHECVLTILQYVTHVLSNRLEVLFF
jgi:hypothetical protein